MVTATIGPPHKGAYDLGEDKAMGILQWSPVLEFGIPVIDDDHREAFRKLEILEGASEEQFPALFSDFVHHLSDHFAREERLMREYGFFALHCHSDEHARVLAEIDGIVEELVTGNHAPARGYALKGFPEWFAQHHATMDAVTAHYLSQTMVEDEASIGTEDPEG